MTDTKGTMKINFSFRMAAILFFLVLVAGWAITVFATTTSLLSVGGGSGATGTTVLSVDHTGATVNSATLTAPTINLDGDVAIPTAGKGIQIKEGANARMGQATLVAGCVTNANTSITTNTRVFMSRATAGGTLGHLSCVVSNGAWFIVNSSTNADTSAVNWMLIEKQ